MITYTPYIIINILNLNIIMKQKRPSSSLKKSSKVTDPNNDSNININANANNDAKSSLAKQIQKIKQQIQSTNMDINKTSKMLDIDLFLKQQKQKRLQYAKNISSEYQAQKRLRQQKLYKKFNRQQKQPEPTQSQKQMPAQPAQSKPQKQSKPIQSQIKFQNIPVMTPLIIAKTMLNKNYQSENGGQFVLNGHHYRPEDISLQGLRTSQDTIFRGLYIDTNEKVKYDGDTESKYITWKNIKQVAQNPLQLSTTPTPIPNNSLIPTTQTSQSMLNALCLMTAEICAETFHQNDSIFLAQLFIPISQTAVTVVVDKIIKIRQFTHKYVNLGCRAVDANVMWPTLVQKCVEKLRSVRALPNLVKTINNSIYTFYGIDPQIVPINNKNVIKQNFYLVLGHLLQEGRVGFMNINGHSKVPYQNRIYILQQIRQHVQPQKNQQAAHKPQIKFKIKNPWRGTLIDSQNINRFSLLQLLQMFNCLVLLRDYPAKWSCLRINVSYFSNGGVSLTSNQWTKNPQYLFTITKSMTIRIVLRKGGELGETKQGIFGFLLFQNKQASNKIQALKMDWLIVKTKSSDMCQASYCTELTKGNYIIIPYCTDQSVKQYQFYTLDFFIEKESNIQFGKARLFDFNYVDKKGSRLNGQSKIIQSLEGVEKFEKPRVEKVEIPTQFKPKITQKILQSLNLNLFKNSSLKHFFIPGMISNLLINKSVQVQLRQPLQTVPTAPAVNDQLSVEEQSQNMETLLGYDCISDDINQGQMRDLLEQSVGVYDFANFQLQQDGLTAILQVLGTQPQIIQIDLSGNQLNDMAITYLCYYVQKGNRTQLRKINVSNNKFGKIGKNALKGLVSTFPKIAIIGL